MKLNNKKRLKKLIKTKLIKQKLINKTNKIKK